MKYYIPTSSLNLETILQAESISPRSFYEKRKTGYKSIELIDEVKRFDSIILFDYPVLFSIEDSGRYNYPLLIEIEDDIQLKGIRNIEGTNTYLCAHTIFLTPQNSTFYFFTDSAYKLTTINTKSNKSIKYYEKYKIFPSASQLKLKPLKIENITEPIASCKSNETTIDKQKGVLYSFLMGQLLSLTPELAHQQRLSQELYNILTGIISNPQMKDNFLTKLKPLLQEFTSIDQIELNNKERFENKLEAELGRFRFLKHCFIDILEKWEVWNYIVDRLSSKWECDWLPNITDSSSTQDFVELRNKIEIRTNDAMAEYQKKQPAPSVENVFKNEDVFLIKDMPIINKAVDYIIKNQLTADYLTANRQKICKELIKDVVIEEIKNIKGSEYWESSSEQSYFNSLYAHIGDLGKPFDLKSIDNPELLAIASFLLRGQDINGLLAYLKSNEICDYRYPLVLWGALCGYMEMNKELLSEILTLENYRNVYECLFHQPMGEPKFSHDKEVSQFSSDKADNNETTLFINALISKCKSATKDENVYIHLFEKHGMSKELLEEVKNNTNLNKGKGAQKTIISWIEKQVKSQNKKTNNPSSQELFIEEKPPIGSEFYNDISALEYLANMLPQNKKIRIKFKEDLDWFQDEYKKGSSSQYYAKASRDNNSVIEAYKRYLTKKKYANKINISQIISKLKDLYL